MDLFQDISLSFFFSFILPLFSFRLFTHTHLSFFFRSQNKIMISLCKSWFLFDFIVVQRNHNFIMQQILYTLVAHAHKDFFSHIIYTRKNPSIHIFLLHSYMRNIFLFLYIRRHLFTTLLSFYHDFGSFFLFWTTLLNEKFYAISELQQTLLTTTK